MKPSGKNKSFAGAGSAGKSHAKTSCPKGTVSKVRYGGK